MKLVFYTHFHKHVYRSDFCTSTFYFKNYSVPCVLEFLIVYLIKIVLIATKYTYIFKKLKINLFRLF